MIALNPIQLEILKLFENENNVYCSSVIELTDDIKLNIDNETEVQTGEVEFL